MVSGKSPYLYRAATMALAVMVAAGTCVTAYSQTKKRPAGPPTSRTTTDPPIPSQGKLGQDLFLAIDHRDLAAVKSLLKGGADPNSRNGLMFTPLYIASASHQPEVMEALIAAGAKVDAPSPYGAALTFAALGSHPQGIAILLKHGANVSPMRADQISPLMLASRMGDPVSVKELIARKADVNGKDNDGATPLIYAAREGNIAAAQMLLEAGASVDAADSHGRTPLMYAAIRGHADFVKAMLEKGANVNARDSKGRTALVLSARYGDYPDVARALLDKGADPKAADSTGRTAAACAAARGHAEVARLLGATDSASPAVDSRKAVQASLGLIDASMKQFVKRTGCISCHQEGLGRIATAAARAKGFPFDSDVNQAQLARINGGLTELQPLHLAALKSPEAMKQVPLIEIEEAATGDCWILAGMAEQKDSATPGAGAMAMVVARQQTPAGNWQFALPRVPMQSSFFTFTALAIRSLKAYAPKSYATEVAERIQRAKSWLLTAPAQTSEDRASRLLGLKWAGATETERKKAVDAIRADQRPDGGWSQLPTLQSDAYATGQALYALHAGGGLAVSDTVYQKGVQYLLRTQEDDGSWFVAKRALPANNYFDAGFPHGQSQYSSFNGTCWATLALLQTVDSQQQAKTASR